MLFATSDTSGGNGRAPEEKPTFWQRIKILIFGSPRDILDRSLFHKISLIPFLAWIGLGADGLSSSTYGPEEAFRALGSHAYLALGLAALTATAIIVISAAYSHIVERFPTGGGGYIVATKLLGPKLGVVSGCALLVDYVLTITMSVSAAGDALFSFVPLPWHAAKLPLDIFFIIGLTMLNIRGVKESVLALTPIFIVFLITHLVMIVGGVLTQASAAPALATAVSTSYSNDMALLGPAALLMMLMYAFSMGGGTYTGIEAVSNGVMIMREPRVQTAKRTMLYMAASLAFTSAGLLVCYLLWEISPVPGQTMNATLAQRFFAMFPFGSAISVVTLLSEGALLVVAAQAGFIDGPRVLSNLAVDYWAPRRFAFLSDRLTTQNGILLMGAASLVALLYTKGDIHHIVVMYSINVFLTFTLSMLGMCLLYWKTRGDKSRNDGHLGLFIVALLFCTLILVVTVYEKFLEGGWITLTVTGTAIILCFFIKRHYRGVGSKLAQLFSQLEDLPTGKPPENLKLNPDGKTAAVLVASYSGLGIHTILNIFHTFPGLYDNLVFLSVGLIDSGNFKGEDSVDHLRAQTEDSLKKYVELARRLGVPSTYRLALGHDVVDESVGLCQAAAAEFPRITFFAGKAVFQQERWYHRILHNETAFSVQKRLQWQGKTMVILPARIPN